MTAVDIGSLIESMTLEEKIGQMTLATADLAVTGPKASIDNMAAVRSGRVGTILHLWGPERTRAAQRVAVEESRLKIPLMFACDVIHGHKTLFPIPLAEAATFHTERWQETARLSALEASADGFMINFAPMIDIARDARWGRIAESPGEDPWLAARFAEAKVRGYQNGDLAAADSLAATAKHLAGYGASIAGRDYAAVEISERSFHEVYLPPFHAAVRAGVAAIMPAFTDQGGMPLTANAPVLRDLLRTRWGFDGVVVSDYTAIDELLPHGVAKDLAEAAALALRAGVDIDLMGDGYPVGLPVALERGLVTMAEIDTAVGRVLALKAALGLFEDPYRRCAGAPGAHRDVLLEASREMARRAIVLLTDRDRLLPMPQAPGRLAVIGPLADARAEMMGPWSMYADGDDMVSLLDGLRATFADSEIGHEAGVPIQDEAPANIAAALELARAADVVVLCLGEAARMSGEAACRARPGLPGRQAELAEAVLAQGKPTIVLLSSGRPIVEPCLFERASTVLATWFLGSAAGHAVGDVLAGRCNPSGRLPVSWPFDIGQIPVYFGQQPVGRPPDPDNHYTSKYLDIPVAPAFPFGHGLSYSAFDFDDLRVSAAELRPGERLTVEVEVTNQSSVAGEETVLLFTHDPVGSVARPLLELKGVTKVHLAAGERATARLSLAAEDLIFVGADLTPRLEPGTIEILVGPCADRAKLLETTVELVAG